MVIYFILQRNPVFSNSIQSQIIDTIMGDSCLEAKKALVDVIIETIEFPDDMLAAPTLATTNTSDEDTQNDNMYNDNRRSKSQSLIKDESSDKISLYVTDLATFEQKKVSQNNSINKDTLHEMVGLLLCANLDLNVACMLYILIIY